MSQQEEKNLKILLCEDDESLGMLLREYLQAKGYDADLCPDGEAGYKAFLKNNYDMCVLDVMMPKMDGFALAEEIRQANSDIPIIFLSEPSLDDRIVVLDASGVQTIYFLHKTKKKWGRNVPTKVGNRTKQIWTEGGAIPSGTGFWYNRAATDELSIKFGGVQ